MRRGLRVIAAVLAVAGIARGSGPALAQEEPGIVVEVDCLAPDEEVVTVTNSSEATVTIVSIGSLLTPEDDEPLPFDDELAPGDSISYNFGAEDGPADDRFDDEPDTEYVVVTLDLGTVSVPCGLGVAVLPLGAGGASAEPSPDPTVSAAPSTGIGTAARDGQGMGLLLVSFLIGFSFFVVGLTLRMRARLQIRPALAVAKRAK